MDPLTLITAGTTLAGFATSIFGGQKKTEGAQEAAAASAEQARLEQQVEAQRMSAMELDARRRQREIIRTQQKAAALGTAAAVSQGAEGGSGLQGGLAGIMGQTGVNLLGVTQNLEIGRNIFGINAQISQQKIRAAQAGAKMAEGQGLQQLGGALVSSGPNFAKVATSIPSLLSGPNTFTGQDWVASGQNYQRYPGNSYIT
jgi:hypothetical protein